MLTVTPQETVDEWNKSHPVGTKVVYTSLWAKARAQDAVTTGLAHVRYGRVPCIWIDIRPVPVPLRCVRPLLERA